MSNDCISPSATLRPEKHIRKKKKKLKAKEFQDGMAHGSVIRRKTAEDFEEKVGTA